MRVPARSIREYPFFARLLFTLQKRKYGEVLYPSLLWARVPSLFAAVSLLYGVLQRKTSRLDASLRSLILVRISQMNGCNFCIDINSAMLAKQAGALDKTRAVSQWNDNGLFDSCEQCALAYAEAITSGQKVSHELSRHLSEHFDDDAIVELTALIAYQNMSTRFNNALDIPSQGFCELES